MGILINYPHNQSVYYTLFALKYAYVLQIGLNKFAQLFYSRFSKEVKKESIYRSLQFKAADVLIEEAFPYVPLQKINIHESANKNK